MECEKIYIYENFLNLVKNVFFNTHITNLWWGLGPSMDAVVTKTICNLKKDNFLLSYCCFYYKKKPDWYLLKNKVFPMTVVLNAHF